MRIVFIEFALVPRALLAGGHDEPDEEDDERGDDEAQEDPQPQQRAL